MLRCCLLIPVSHPVFDESLHLCPGSVPMLYCSASVVQSWKLFAPPRLLMPPASTPQSGARYMDPTGAQAMPPSSPFCFPISVSSLPIVQVNIRPIQLLLHHR